MKKTNNNFKHDLRKIYAWKIGSTNPSLLKKMRLWFFCFELHCIAAYRFNRLSKQIYNKNKILGFIPRIIGVLLRSQSEFFHHVSIAPYTDIGPGFLIRHASNIYIGASRIGENFTVYQNTIVGWGVSDSDGEPPLPEIGDNVWMGPSSIVFGKVLIGSNSSISAGAVVSKSIPEKSLVAGNPGRVIHADYVNPIQKTNTPADAL